MLIEFMRESLKQAQIKNEDALIKGMWGVDCLFQPKKDERVFDCDFVVAQTMGQGCAYGNSEGFERNYLRSLIGKNYFELSFTDAAVEIAIMDSLYEKVFPVNWDYEICAQGTSAEKLHKRSEIIFNEAMHLLEGKKDKKVVNVGVVGDIIKTFVDEGIDISGTDFDSEIIGKEMFSKAPIYDGAKSLDYVAAADVAVVTGMALATGTIDGILKTAKQNNTKIIIFAETGANMADAYIKCGADVFVSEPFPFYIFNGESKMRVIRKSK